MCRDSSENRSSHAAAASLPTWDTEPLRIGETHESESTESRLAALAAAVGPLRRILAAIAARVIETRSYERLCYARLGDYARERAGISARQLQDLARVHRAFATLPGLERALVTNELPWSKVRLVARVATAEDEHAWIDRARAVPTRRLERDVRDAARAGERDDLDAEEPLTRVTIHCTPAVREKWDVTCEMAERVAGARLGAGDVLELVAAEAFSSLSLDPDLGELADDCARPSRDSAALEEAIDAPPAAREPARRAPGSVEALARGLDAADAFELDRRLAEAVRLEQTLDAAIAPLLRVVAAREYEWSGDLRTFAGFARDELGMSESKARTLLRLERAGDVCPELRDAYRSGRISWVKAQCLLPLLVLDLPGDWRDVWVAWAERVTVRRLAEDVARALLLRAGTDLAWQRCKHHPELAQDPIPESERQLCAREIDTEATERIELRVPNDVAWLLRGVRETLAARLRARDRLLRSESEVFAALLDLALHAWTRRDAAARRSDPVVERDGYRCAVPGCTSRRSLHDHHVTFRSAGGSDAPDNRVTLCAFHHLRGVHAGSLRIYGTAPHDLVFELGLRAEARPLARYRSGDVSLAASVERRGAVVSRAA